MRNFPVTDSETGLLILDAITRASWYNAISCSFLWRAEVGWAFEGDGEEASRRSDYRYATLRLTRPAVFLGV